MTPLASATRLRTPARTLIFGCFAALALVLAPASVCRAQGAHFGGVVFPSDSGLTSYGGIAVDSAMDVFLSDNASRQVVEFNINGSQTILSTGGAQPEYMTLDKANNLYVAVTAPAGVLKFP